MHNSYNFFLNPHISFHTRVKNPEKIRIITSKWEVMLYYVRRYILIRNFKPLHIIHFLIFFHENWYKYVLFHAEFIFIHHFEKYSIVQKIMGKIQCLTTVAMETHFLAGSNCVTTCFPQFLNSATIKYLICKFSCLYPEVHTIFSKPLQYK